MKSFLIFVVVLLLAIPSVAQPNTLYWTMRVKVKLDKVTEWEKKAPLFMKTHYPQFKFRVYESLTGGMTGSYFIVIGPLSYKDLDAPPVFPKGLALLKTDRQALDGLCESIQVMHYAKAEDLSNNNAERKLAYQIVNVVELQVGQWQDVKPFLAKVKTAREQTDLKVDYDYFRPQNSGAANFYVSVRYLEKLEDLDKAENLDVAYDKVNGKGSWYNEYAEYLGNIKSVVSELRVLRDDLSTPVSPSTVSN
jgi:hypothetical protein